MKLESFSFSVHEYAQQLTQQHHLTIRYLRSIGYITEDTMNHLLESTIVTPIKNDLSFGERILRRFFKKQAEENSYVFVVSTLAPTFGEIDDNVGRKKVTKNTPPKLVVDNKS